jgi:hypothetical protein
MTNGNRFRTLSLVVALLAALAASAAVASPALASGGDYSIAGGTRFEQAQVHEALAISTFDWYVVETDVTIHIVRGLPQSYSIPGQIWLDAGLLDSGTFSWGVVQMEYGQQVQYSTLDPAMQAVLTGALGGSQWCYENPSVPMPLNACERFAATLAWAYWPSGVNSMKPAGVHDVSGSMAPAAFRTLLAHMIAAPDRIDSR